MRLLLDTHALIWWFDGDARLSGEVRSAINQEDADVLVSVVSAFEMRTKRRIGKLHGLDELIDKLPSILILYGFSTLSITMPHAELAGSLPIPHRDPFDRLLIAQAQIEDALLVSNEQIFDDFSVRRVW